MLRFLKLLVIAPFAILFLIFAFANRHFITISFDPFETASDIPAYSVQAPLFIVLTLAIMFGVVVGGMATWFGQGRYRRAARANRAEAEKLRADLEAARAAAPVAFAKRA
jgi:uncharacterized integral membrane protein